MKLLVATRNPHKLREILAIVGPEAHALVGVDDFPDLPEVDETGTTLESNAIKKAVTLALATKLWTMADDSGLEVDALDGAPGVHSARYAGEPVDYEANNRKLIQELSEKPDRTARFHCVIALSSPSGRAQIVTGQCEGTIVVSPRGENGFGYDPLFIPDGYEETFAEMDTEAKNRISHRASALDSAKEKWGEFLAGDPTDWPVRSEAPWKRRP